MTVKTEKDGIIYGALSYVLWGIAPIYWKLLTHVNALEILSHRVLWSFVFMITLLAVTKKFQKLLEYIRTLYKNRWKFLALLIASLLMSANWGIFIWAVNDGRILETSLGYYINPLISIVLGITVLKEKLNKVQVVSVFLAATGVLVLTVYSGQFPWVSLALALTFGLYGLAKKLIGAEATIGLTLETLLMLPFAFGYLVFLLWQGNSSFLPMSNSLLLMGGGLATALPLLLFALGAINIPLSMLGFLQYIAPTLSLLIGVFIYDEAFTILHTVAFGFIWIALLLFSFSQIKVRSQTEGQVSAEVERL